MHERIRITSHAPHVRTLDHIHEGLIALFAAVKKEQPDSRIGYVAGMITSDGPAKIAENLAKLAAYTEQVRRAHDFPIFSATDVFSDELFARIKPYTKGHADYVRFWRLVQESGYITDLFLTPRWEFSKGAIDEFETAKKLGITIHFVDHAAREPALVHSHSSSVNR